jgi:hypothetical protein
MQAADSALNVDGAGHKHASSELSQRTPIACSCELNQLSTAELKSFQQLENDWHTANPQQSIQREATASSGAPEGCRFNTIVHVCAKTERLRRCKQSTLCFASAEEAGRMQTLHLSQMFIRDAQPVNIHGYRLYEKCRRRLGIGQQACIVTLQRQLCRSAGLVVWHGHPVYDVQFEGDATQPAMWALRATGRHCSHDQADRAARMARWGGPEHGTSHIASTSVLP